MVFTDVLWPDVDRRAPVAGDRHLRRARPEVRRRGTLVMTAGSGLTGAVRPLPSGTVTLLFSDMEGSTRLLSRLGSGVRPSPWTPSAGSSATRGRSTAAPSSAPRATASSWSSTTPRQRCGRRWRASAGCWTPRGPRASGCWCGWGCTPGRRCGTRTATSGWTCTGRRGSPGWPTAARSWSPTRPRRSRGPTAGASGFGFLDLGLHRLKDLPQPEHLFQVTADGLPRDFPPVPSLGLGDEPAAAGDAAGRAGRASGRS